MHYIILHIIIWNGNKDKSHILTRLRNKKLVTNIIEGYEGRSPILGISNIVWF